MEKCSRNTLIIIIIIIIIIVGLNGWKGFNVLPNPLPVSFWGFVGWCSEMVWAQNKINRTCKDDPTGRCTRREKERQTEKEMGRQRNGMDRIKVG